MDKDVRDAGNSEARTAGGKPDKAVRRSRRARKLSSAIESAVASAAARQAVNPYRLPEACTIHEAVALKSALQSLLDAPGAITLDGNAVERIDTAGIQLMACFLRSCRRDERAVTWSGTSAELARAADVLGLRSMLELPVSGG